ncbi:threonine dehydratase [Chelatococcus caeni]|uniref:Threonine dehydratase n=1 Tax=Chelatococcus caeni TaxID=1348468 RepID=A0A840C7V1_9HYPH|nr:pyridoxal-phosphate dependent enzyme [Chelatococcus caeni]MBB4018407.1 threonine dehydratase [Chelatococcus caeni]
MTSVPAHSSASASASSRAIALDEIEAARRHIDACFLGTPLTGHAGLDAALGCRLAVKVETLNPVRSFKGRGTEAFAALALGAGERCVTASAGNFGQGLARALLRRGHSCVVFAATTANPAKIETLRQMGAEVHLAGDDFDAAKDVARAYATERGLRFVEDGSERTIAAGAGTIGVELVRSLAEFDALVVPLGNGALLAGVGAAVRALAPQVEIVAVVAHEAPSMKLSLETGRVVETRSAATIADGIAVRRPIPEALRMLEGCFDAIAAVGEDEIERAMRLTMLHLGLVAEPAGATGLAAVMAGRERFAGRRVATILTGSNVAPTLLSRLFAGGNPVAR